MLTSFMVIGATIAVNSLPRTDRDASLKEKFLSVKLDYINDFRIPFGTYNKTKKPKNNDHVAELLLESKMLQTAIRLLG